MIGSVATMLYTTSSRPLATCPRLGRQLVYNLNPNLATSPTSDNISEAMKIAFTSYKKLESDVKGSARGMRLNVRVPTCRA